MYLLDSDWIIQVLVRQGIAQQELRRLAGSPVYISIVSAGEIFERAFVHANPVEHLSQFRLFLSSYRILGITTAIMELFAEQRALLRRRGQLIPDFDLLIAATALQYDLTLLTFNRRHFERIPELRLYQPG
ncbi:MAG: hypothetical protein DCC58_05865 [Chloroflexi bacterium]|nr:MAG: hypothetical protein DCC58_05865 [Chloroflexota bacterium]